ncbi:unnamed protein product, partial [Scytosiphon promiscuus]
QKEAWDGRRNTVTFVEPAHPGLSRSIESALVLSRLLIVALGVVWVILLLIVAGALGGVDAAATSTAVDAAASPSPTNPLAAPTNGGRAGGNSGAINLERRSLLEEGLKLHHMDDFQHAAETYLRLLEVIPNDPDGLHLLGLALHSQGKLMLNIETSEGQDESKGKLLRTAIRFAACKDDELLMRRNLGEVLRADGDLEHAEAVLRAVVAEQRDEGVWDHEASSKLAGTLIDIIRQRESSPRNLLQSDNRPDSPARDWCEDWRIRSEAEGLLKWELLSRPNDRGLVLNLIALVKSNWDLDSTFSVEKGAEMCEATEGSFFDGGRGAFSVDGHGLGVEDANDADNGTMHERGGNLGEQTLYWLNQALLLDPSDQAIAMERAVVLHRLGRTEEARDRYVEVLAMEGGQRSATRDFARSNLAAIKQANGDASGAIEEYREILAESPENAIVLNNLGAALHALGQYEEGVAMLEKSLKLSPLDPGAMMNLGEYWQEEGDMDHARSLYTRQRSRRNDGLPVRRAIMLSPIMAGEHEIVQEKGELVRAVDDLIARDPPLFIPDPPQGIERVHFYLVYRGGNHREVQEKIARLYIRASPGLLHVDEGLHAEKADYADVGLHHTVGNTGEASLPRGASSTSEVTVDASTVDASTRRRVSVDSLAGVPSDVSPDASSLRVGFVSKYFGEEASYSEPHGMLLDGVIRHLPRKFFRVFVCPIKAPGSQLSPRLAEAADEVLQLPMQILGVAILRVSFYLSNRLDILVYADMNSEPTSHFLGYSRLAKVQAVFWGNPITTGNPSIDYFVSAEVMERQDRTAIAEKDEPYSEQVILLGGQGIWYDRPTAQQLPAGLGDPGTRENTKLGLRRGLKARLGVEEDSVIFMCPQSLFKLKPDFDLVLRDIILAFDGSNSNRNSTTNSNTGKAYLVLMEGHRKLWTEALWRRLRVSVPEMIPLVKMVPRTSAGKEFYTLLASADVLLHPFPFGGSKTAADGLALAVPTVAMEGDALPGRMAFSLYNSMGLAGPADRGCCVARDRESYVELAVRLGRDGRYRQWASDLISRRSWCLWERREVVLEWAKFLSRAAGRPAPSAEEVGLTPGARMTLIPPEIFEQATSKPQDQEQHQPGHIDQHMRNQRLQSFQQAVEADSLHEERSSGVGGQQALRKDGSCETNRATPTPAFTGNDWLATPLPEGSDDGTENTGDGSKGDVIGVCRAIGSAASEQDTCNKTRQIETEQIEFAAAVDVISDTIAAKNNDFGISTEEDAGEKKQISSLTDRFATLYTEGRLHEAAATLQEALRIMEVRRSRRVKAGINISTDNKVVDPNALITAGHRARVGDSNSVSDSPEPGDEDAGNNSEGVHVDKWASENNSSGDGVKQSFQSGLEDAGAEDETVAMARVMNDLGCTLQQLWRLDEAESLLRGAIANYPGYFSAMVALGVTLQAKEKVDEAEVWYREALGRSPLQNRDEALTNLVLLMKADGNRLGEAIDIIVRETSTPPLHQGGSLVAVLSLLQPRPTHRQAFRRVEQRQRWRSESSGEAVGWLCKETNRLRELYPLSMNNLVVFLGLTGGLGGVFDVLVDMAGMEPIYSPREEMTLLPRELRASSSYYHQTKRLEHNLTYDDHSVHVVTQYYVPEDPRRAREIDACLLHNLQNPLVGTVHILVDHPDAIAAAHRKSSIPVGSAPEDSDVGPHRHHRSRTSGDHVSWVETSWGPPVLTRLDEEFAGKARILSLLDGRRLTFRDALRYSNQVLNGQVVLLSNSDVTFDESLARLGDPSTLDMTNKVFALVAWQSKLGWASSTKGQSTQQDSDMIKRVVVKEALFAPRIDSQDTWIFRSPLPPMVVNAADFEMGRPRCDGRLAKILVDAGFSVTSPSMSLVAHHVHASERSLGGHHDPSPSNHTSTSRSALTYRGDTQVAGATAAVLLSDQWLF